MRSASRSTARPVPLLGQQGPQERPLVAPDAAGLVADAVGLDELGVDPEKLAVALVVGQAREAEQGVGDVAGALGGQEVAVVGAAVAVDEPHPGAGEGLEGVDLRRVDLVAEVAGDHQPAKVRAGRPATPGVQAKTEPASGCSSSGRSSREVVMKSVRRSGPPKVQAVALVTGSSTTASSAPDGV